MVLYKMEDEASAGLLSAIGLAGSDAYAVTSFIFTSFIVIY